MFGICIALFSRRKKKYSPDGVQWRVDSGVHERVFYTTVYRKLGGDGRMYPFGTCR